MIDLIIFALVCLICAYHQTKPLYWTIILGVTLAILTIIEPGFIVLILWILYGLAAGFIHAETFRRKFITARIQKLLRKTLPTMSQAEIDAANAGNVWWEKELFSGNPDWSILQAYPKPTLSAEEQSFIDNQIDTLCSMVDDWKIVREDHDLSPAVWAYLKQEKFLGMVIPKEYGGLGFSALAHSTAVAKVATRSSSTAINMMVPNSLGPGELLLHYGTEAQKSFYLPRLARGEEIPCFALTGTDAGSDASSITDRGIICQQSFEGKPTLGLRLTWDKRYITLAPVATVLGLAVRLYDPDHLLGPTVDVGITLCLIPTSHPGVETGTRHFPLYLGFMNGPTRGKEVFIPMDWIIGGPARVGQGWKMLMECLSIGRSISLPALSAGCSQMAYRVTGAYSRIRKQFNIPIAYFEGVEELLAGIAGPAYLLEAARTMTAGAVDLGIKPSIVSAIAKYHMTETTRKVIDCAMDVHAGHGIQVGPSNLLANVYMSMPMSITVEGANALTRNLIIFGQGLVLCHPYLAKELALINQDGPDARAAFDKTFLGHLSYTLRNMAQAFWHAMTGGYLIRVVFKHPPRHKKIKYYYQQITVVSSVFAFFTDLAVLVMGGSLKRRERISARLGDVLSQMYLASTVLKYFQDQNEPEADLPYVQWCMQTCMSKAQVALRELADNFPVRVVGWLLRCFIPYAKIFTPPSDALCHKVVTPMLSDSPQRDRLTHLCYRDQNPQSWFAQAEQALQQIAAIEPVQKKFQSAIRHGKVAAWLDVPQQVQAAVGAGVLSAEEGQAFLAFEKLRHEVIKVGEFSFDLKTVLN